MYSLFFSILLLYRANFLVYPAGYSDLSASFALDIYRCRWYFLANVVSPMSAVIKSHQFHCIACSRMSRCTTTLAIK